MIALSSIGSTIKNKKQLSLVPKERLQDLNEIHKWVSKWNKSFSFDLIPGDASSRRYYRIKEKNKSYVVMKMQPFADAGLHLPFLDVQRHLHRLEVAVPEVLEVNPAKGLILMSDLGDETLLKRLETVHSKKEQIQLFKKAINLLLRMQLLATQLSAPIEAYGLYFDDEKLLWEVGFTLAHFYNGTLAQQVSAKDQKAIEKYFRDICKVLSSQEWYFTHRDFHSRNIMVYQNAFYMIDFQDARLGCMHYDLASLLRDSYYQLEEDVVYELIEYYLEKKSKIEGKKHSRKEFERIFDLMSIQRNFKAMGSFASFFMKRNDVRYLKFIGNTFENIRRNLLKFPEYDELRQLLFKYYYF